MFDPGISITGETKGIRLRGWIIRRAGTIAVVVAAAVALTLFAWTFDVPMGRLFWSAHHKTNHAFQFITRFGDSAWYLWPLGLAVLYAAFMASSLGVARAGRLWQWLSHYALFLFSAVAVPGIVVNLLKVILGRARPRLFQADHAEGLHPFSFDYLFHSFPSGHASVATAMALGLAFFIPSARLWFFLAGGMIAISRLFVEAHYPSDIIGGILIAGFLAYWLRGFFADQRVAFVRRGDGQIVPQAAGRLLRVKLKRQFSPLSPSTWLPRLVRP